jgi:hypothetical protein
VVSHLARFPPPRGCSERKRAARSIPEFSAGVAAPFRHGRSARIERTPNAHRPRAVQDVRVNHRRRHVLVTQKLLDRPNIITRFEQVGRETVPERVAARWLWDFGVANRLLDGLLDDGFVEVMAANDARPGIVRRGARLLNALFRRWRGRAGAITARGVVPSNDPSPPHGVPLPALQGGADLGPSRSERSRDSASLSLRERSGVAKVSRRATWGRSLARWEPSSRA